MNHPLVLPFTNKIHLLMVEDNLNVMRSMVDLFSSPLFAITTEDSVAGARKTIAAAKHPWHCWLCDMALETETAGLDLVRWSNGFPFIVMLSGLKSMSLASQAINLGAYKVFDKNPANLTDLYTAVCSVASLGYLLRGKYTKNLPAFSVLQKAVVASPCDWAFKALLSERHLQRICRDDAIVAPRLALPLYYALYYTLLNGKSYSASEIISASEQPHYADCLKTIEKNIEQVAPTA